MDAVTAVVTTASAVPKPLPPNPLSLLKRRTVKRWRIQVDAARGQLHDARQALVAAVDTSAP